MTKSKGAEGTKKTSSAKSTTVKHAPSATNQKKEVEIVDKSKLKVGAGTSSISNSKSEAKSGSSLKKHPVASDNRSYGTGRRKSSIARVWVFPGKGVIVVNKKPVEGYFQRDFYLTTLKRPFEVTNTLGQYDVMCTVKGGGTTGQAGAILHGIARALDAISEDFHDPLHKAGLLTRDSRVVERKKYGQHKARKKTQFSKR